MAAGDEVAEKDAQQDGATSEAGATPKRSRLPLLLILGGVVVLVLGGGVTAYVLGVFGGGKGEAEAAKAVGGHGKGEKGHGSKGHGSDGAGVGAVVPLDTFVANLADEDGRRYLKATIQVEFLHETPGTFTERLPQIRDLLLTLLSSKTFAEVRTTEGKQQLREEVITRLNRVLDEDAVKAVYFTEFIVQ
jgi:flagellar FliL protein